jgi:hypothetical protein
MFSAEIVTILVFFEPLVIPLIFFLAVVIILVIDIHLPRVAKAAKWLVALPFLPILWPYLFMAYARNAAEEAAWKMDEAEAANVVASAGSSPYEILGLRPGCSDRDVKKAFWRMAKACHPDRASQHGLGNKEAEEQFKKICAAYNVLTKMRSATSSSRSV